MAASETFTGVPRSRIAWRDGQNRVRLVAFRAGTQEQVTVEMTLDEWMRLEAVRYAQGEAVAAADQEELDD